MYEIFVGALNGDPLYQQHLSWLLRKPAFWLTVAKWALVVVGIIWIFRILFAARKWKAVGAFTAILAGTGLVGFIVYQQAKVGFENAQGGGLPWLGFGLVTNIFAIGVIVMLWRRLRNRGPHAPEEPRKRPTVRPVVTKLPENKEYEFHIWLGHYASMSVVTDFFAEQYEEYDQPLSKFAQSQGQRSYDHDGIEYGYMPDQTLDSWLNLSDGSKKGALADAYRISQERGIIDATIYVQANNDEFTDPQSVAIDGLKLKYMGAFRETYEGIN